MESQEIANGSDNCDDEVIWQKIILVPIIVIPCIAGIWSKKGFIGLSE